MAACLVGLGKGVGVATFAALNIMLLGRGRTLGPLGRGSASQVLRPFLIYCAVFMAQYRSKMVAGLGTC